MTARAAAGLCLLLSACAPPAARSTGVGNFQRPSGMPIGTGAAGGQLDALEPGALEAAAGGDVTDNSDLTLPTFEAAPERPPPARVPCAGCVELNVDVSDINQRDEFAFDAGGARISRVVWTVLVSFNSDQLAVQPFVNDKHGNYTALHVNTFPLATPVEVEQRYSGKARQIGLIVGSSGAWTGDQTMSVFIDAVRVEGPDGFVKAFTLDAEGLAPRTHARNPKVVVHAER